MVWTLSPVPTPPTNAFAAWPREQSAKCYVSVPPTGRVITADQLRVQCRIDDPALPGNDDDSLNLWIDAATSYAEGRLAASLMPRTIVANFYDYEPLDLPRGPVIAVQTVTDRNSASVTQFTFRGIGHTTRIVLTNGAVYPITVTYQAGYVATDGTTPCVPQDIVAAIKMHAASLYANRESISDTAKMPIPHALDAFYDLKCRSTGVA